MNASDSRNWFDQGGQAYARFRPEYPLELAETLAALAPGTRAALDAGCGNGQLTVQLAEHFDRVVGADPSTDQLANAIAHPRVRYLCAPAENLPLADGSVQLITAAQAAHWFDLPRFYHEVQRVLVPQGVVALISYGVLEMSGPPGERFREFYWKEIGPYWPAQRKLVDSGYADLPFPYTALDMPRLAIRKAWTLHELLGYISTWSAVRSAREAAREDILHAFASDMAAMWGGPGTPHTVSWPVTARVGYM